MRLRVAGHKVLLGILDQLGNPLLLARAADFSRGAEAAAAYGDKVAAIIDDGETSTTQAASVVQIRGDKWTVTEVGAITETTLKAALPTLILFVCTGNTCRSPLAEALCKKLLAERLGCQLEDLAQRGFVVQSAGLAAMSGAPATPEAVEVGGEYGADLSGHCSQPLTAELLARADYLFTMTQSHLRALVLFCAQSVAEPRLLAADGHDIPDPIGAELPVYRECAAEILRNLKEWLPQIQPL
jgi:protein-tyrosine phosphatase